ncbi:type II toxin-antitoxin system prevent-host-death family antitoxin [Micromonospora inyonensis]|uniref:type II toxin-antitoxin system prevent-host-death family antitoxin n=1 Tax=Micromonospora inyonensis TaxID=47866 RepID=UPI001FE1A24D|nr:type II toxin-antitoxin system prevent-host-death family antitoxin [Micromonospora inyonensis]
MRAWADVGQAGQEQSYELYDPYVTEPARDLSISDARDHLADVVSRAAYAGRITYVTRRGQRMAAIVPVEVAEAIERAEDAEDVAAAREALARIDAGDEPISLADLRAELGL